MPNTRRRRRRDSTVELSRDGGMNPSAVVSDPVYNLLCSVGLLRLMTGDDTNNFVVEKVISTSQNSRSR